MLPSDEKLAEDNQVQNRTSFYKLLLCDLGMSSVSQLLTVQRPLPSAVPGRTPVTSTDVGTVPATRTPVDRLVGRHVTGGVLGMSHHLVRDVLPSGTEQFLESDDCGEHQGDLPDQQGLAGDQRDRREREFAQNRHLQGGGGQQRAEDPLHFLLLTAALLDSVFLPVFVPDGPQRTRGGTHGLHDVASLQVDLDRVPLQESLDAVQQQVLDGLVAVQGPGRALGFVVIRLHNLDAVGDRDRVLVPQHLVDEGKQLVLDARHGVLAQAVRVDAVQQVVLGLYGVPRVARLLGGRKGVDRRRDQVQEDQRPVRYRHRCCKSKLAS